MDKQPVGQLPDLSQSTNDNEIMVITNPEYNTLQKEKISNLITDFMSKNTDNALIKGTDNKLFVKNYGNADNITEGTINSDLLPESGVTAGTYTTPTNLQVNSKGQITSISEGTASGISQEDIDTVAARPLSDNACTQENFPDEFDYWYKQKYTTFNKDYISTIGTPTMSEYGVITNCGDYDYFLTPSIDVTTADSWEMRFTYTPSGTTPTTAIGLFGSSWLTVSFTTANKITATVNYTGGSLTLTSSGTFATDDKIFCKIRYDSTGYKLYASVNPFDYGTAATNSQIAKAASAQALKLGNVSATSYLSQGSIDMKYFEFDINGANVQNYKQTGIDTIKAPDYTVVGSPTISADGIASGFSNGNYLKMPNLPIVEDNITMTCNVNIGVIGTAGFNYIMGWYTNESSSYLRFIYQNGKINIQWKDKNLTFGQAQSNNVDPNSEHLLKFELTESNLKCYLDNVLFANVDVEINLDALTPDIFTIGRMNNVSSWFLNQGSIDLNLFKVYVDGSLVYQPCLLIPYTETTDGTKIVDAAYFDRVKSCYEQTGQALYLTLDEQNQAYYLPQGTVSGMISRNKQGLEEIEARIEQIKAQIGFTLFDTKITDHVLSGNDAVGWALQGSLVTNIYTDAVSNIASAYASGTATTYREITCKRATDGRYIADISQKTAIDELFEETGVADFYIYDSANSQFYLPKNKWFMQLTTDSTAVNQYNESALPNITAAGTGFGVGLTGQISGAAYNTGVEAERIAGGSQVGRRIDFNASRSSSVYTSGQTEVQPPSSNKLLYYKVGDTLTNDTAIDIGNMSNIISDLSSKTQIDDALINGSSGYILLSNNTLIQWGNSGTSGSTNLLKSYANTNYIILTGHYNGPEKGLWANRFCTHSKTTTSFGWNIESMSNYWLTIGQGA